MTSFTFPPLIRFLAILQLCLCFTAFLYYLCAPFLLARYETRKSLSELEYVMGIKEGIFQKKEEDFKERLAKNQEYFLSLPQENKNQIENKRTKLLREDEEFSLFQKIYALFSELLIEGFPYRQIFLAAGFIGALFILLDHHLVLLFLFIGTAAPILELSTLPKNLIPEVLPTEEFLISHYIDENFNKEPILSQMKLLQEALDRYFGETYGNSPFFKGERDFQEKIARGKWLYSTELLLSKLKSYKEKGSGQSFLIFESLLGMIVLVLAFSSKTAYLIKTRRERTISKMRLP